MPPDKYSSEASLSYDSPFWTSGTSAPAFFDTTHSLKSLSGSAMNADWTTGDLGDDSAFTLLQRVKPKWLVSPTSATMTNYYKYSEGDKLHLQEPCNRNFE